MFNKIQMLDNNLLFFIQENLKNPVLDKIMIFVTRLGDGGMLWIALTVLLLIRKKYRKTGITMLIGLIFCFVSGNLILKPLIARARPYLQLNYTQLLIAPLKDYSFPSGHTMVSFASAVILYKNGIMGRTALILAFFIGFSRLYLFVHFPSDVIAGMIIGILWGILAVKICTGKL